MTSRTARADMLRLPARRAAVPTRTRLRTVRLPLGVLLAALLLIPTVTVAGAMAEGWWATTGRPTGSASAAGAPQPAHAQADPQTGDAIAGGRSDPSQLPASADDVRGWMTARQILDAFPRVTTAELYAQFGVPADTASSTELKDLAESGNGFDLPALRQWLKRHP